MYEEESSFVLEYVSGEFWRHLWKKLLKTTFLVLEQINAIILQIFPMTKIYLPKQIY